MVGVVTTTIDSDVNHTSSADANASIINLDLSYVQSLHWPFIKSIDGWIEPR